MACLGWVKNLFIFQSSDSLCGSLPSFLGAAPGPTLPGCKGPALVLQRGLWEATCDHRRRAGLEWWVGLWSHLWVASRENVGRSLI